MSAEIFADEEYQARSLKACRDMDTNFFYPDTRTGSTAAIAVCRTCPEIFLCLAFALENNEKYGVWGGTSERTRVEMIKKLVPTPVEIATYTPLHGFTAFPQ